MFYKIKLQQNEFVWNDFGNNRSLYKTLSAFGKESYCFPQKKET